VNTLLYVSGEPGVGKSTLMAELTVRWERLPLPGSPSAPARDLLRVTAPGELTPRVVAVELGRRRDSFSGTDALPQTVIDAAEVYLASGQAARETALLLAEGARLANRRFLQAALEAGWRVILAHLDGAEVAAARRRARAEELGVPEQDPSWVAGRRTAAANLADLLRAWGCPVLVLDASWEPAQLRAILEPVIGALVP
jgi:hypothetical protein